MTDRGFLSEEKERAMTEALRTGRGGEISMADVEAALRWAVHARMSANFLDLVIEGRLNITGFRNGELVFVAARQDESQD